MAIRAIERWTFLQNNMKNTMLEKVDDSFTFHSNTPHHRVYDITRNLDCLFVINLLQFESTLVICMKQKRGIKNWIIGQSRDYE